MNYTLLTDLYQLTMAYGYWKNGMQDHEAVFHLFYRKNPFKGNYAVVAGLEQVIILLNNFRFEDEDLAYLASLRGNDGEPLFEAAFLSYLKSLRFDGTVYAIPEGNIVFPHEPLLRIQGNIVLCQLLETPLLNILNFQTLIATKASRVCHAAAGGSVLEFGLRRAQGADGGLSASRAAFIGGCDATSNVLAGKLFGIPVRGTHAHSWVMSFDSEQAAFDAYGDAMPNNCVFLVDTYNTVEGVKKAIQTGLRLQEQGHKLAGIRLDSGDLAALSIAARELLDAAGFTDARIVASNDLDEYSILELRSKGAKIDVWGVGTKLATAYDQAALGGVYKLGAIREIADSPWKFRVKRSEQLIKVSNPGILQVRRYYDNEGKVQADMLYNEIGENGHELIDFHDNKSFNLIHHKQHDLLIPIFEQGKNCYVSPTTAAIREHHLQSAQKFDAKLFDFEPYAYSCGLEKQLYELKMKLLSETV